MSAPVGVLFWRGGFRVGLGAGLLLATAAAAAVPPSILEQARRSGDWEVACAWDLLHTLRLSRAQADKLLPHVEHACRLIVEDYAASKARFGEAAAAYSAYRDQKRRNVGIDPAVEDRAAAAHEAIKSAELALDAARVEIEQAILKDVLTARQRALADAYKVDRASLIQKHDGAARNRPHRGPAVIPSGGKSPSRASDERNTVQERLLDAVRDEAEEIREFQNPRCGPVGRYLLAPGAADLIYRELGTHKPAIVLTAQRVATVGTREYPRARYEADAEAVLALKHEIQGWNLLNGLNLELSQVRGLADIARRALRVQANQAAVRAAGQPKDHGAQDAQFDRALRGLEDAAMRLLTPGQRRVLDEFVVCFKGKPNLRDPVRIGQADVSTRMIDWLERGRQLEGDALMRFIEHRVDSEEKRLLGPLSERERRYRVTMLLEGAREAAAMTDLEFALDGPTLAERLAAPNRPAELSDRIDEIHRAAGQTGKLARLMFTRTFLHVLDARRADLTSRTVRTAAPPADGSAVRPDGPVCVQPAARGATP